MLRAPQSVRDFKCGVPFDTWRTLLTVDNAVDAWRTPQTNERMREGQRRIKRRTFPLLRGRRRTGKSSAPGNGAIIGNNKMIYNNYKTSNVFIFKKQFPTSLSLFSDLEVLTTRLRNPDDNIMMTIYFHHDCHPSLVIFHAPYLSAHS